MEHQEKHPLYEAVLKFLGSDGMDRHDVEGYYHDLITTFDRAVEIARSPTIGDFVNAEARPIVIGGAWELIESGFHREAMFWILLMRTICQSTMDNDASGTEKEQSTRRYERLLAAQGLVSADDLTPRAQYGERLLEQVMRVAEEIIETNPSVSEPIHNN